MCATFDLWFIAVDKDLGDLSISVKRRADCWWVVVPDKMVGDSFAYQGC